MEVHFHSDASNNDWGVRLSAYGILQVRSFDRAVTTDVLQVYRINVLTAVSRLLASAKRA